MSPESLEQALRDLPRTGQLIKERPYRQIWRIEIDGCGVFLKFYPRTFGRLKRTVLGNPALREFSRLQLLQKANVPAPRAISVLMGFHIGAQLGDAVLMYAIEPGITLDQYFNEFAENGKTIPQRREIAGQITQIVQKLIQSRLGHRDLHLGNFLLSKEKVYLLDAYAVRRGPMRKSDLLMLGHSVRPYAAKTEILRAWENFGGQIPPLANNRISRKFWAKEMSRIRRENAYFGRLIAGEWQGFFFKSRKYPAPWSMASRLRLSATDWNAAWPRLLGQLESQQWSVMAGDSRGQLLAGEIVLAGVPLQVMAQRPRSEPTDIALGSRAKHAWTNAWSLVVRNIPTTWPLLVMERRKLGRTMDQIILFEKTPGLPLSSLALDEMDRGQRDQLFHRVGRLLRQMEMLGLYHADATANHFVIQSDPAHGLVPVLINVDAIHKIGKTQSSIDVLLKSLRREQAAYNPADSYALCRGYAPAARMEIEY